METKIFKTKEYLKSQLAATMRQKEHLVLRLEELKAINRGLCELIKVYEAICLVMGEDFIEKRPKNAEEKHKRLSEILKLLIFAKPDDNKS